MNTAGLQITRSNSKVYVATGVILLAGIWTTVGVMHHYKAKRDENAVAFFSELQRDIAPDTVGLVESNAFDIRYWENTGKKLKKPMYLLTQASAKAYAKDIQDSWGFFMNNRDKIKSVFRALKDQVQVSQMAYQYYLTNPDKINLIDDLKSKLNTEQVGEILDIVKKMPPYRLAEPPKTS